MGIDSTGTDFYLVADNAVLTTKANCVTAIATGKQILKVKNLGDIGATLAVTETKYLNADSEKSLGSPSYGNFPIETPFDPLDAKGQNELKTMFSTKSARKLIIVNTDGTYTIVPVKCSSKMKTYANDEMVLFKATLEQNGAEVEVTA